MFHDFCFCLAMLVVSCWVAVSNWSNFEARKLVFESMLLVGQPDDVFSQFIS